MLVETIDETTDAFDLYRVTIQHSPTGFWYQEYHRWPELPEGSARFSTLVEMALILVALENGGCAGLPEEVHVEIESYWPQYCIVSFGTVDYSSGSPAVRLFGTQPVFGRWPRLKR